MILNYFSQETQAICNKWEICHKWVQNVKGAKKLLNPKILCTKHVHTHIDTPRTTGRTRHCTIESHFTSFSSKVSMRGEETSCKDEKHSPKWGRRFPIVIALPSNMKDLPIQYSLALIYLSSSSESLARNKYNRTFHSIEKTFNTFLD